MMEAHAEAPVPDHVASDATATQSPVPETAPLDPLPLRPPASSARAAASRANGAKSRGPKSPQGKERSKLNRLKHGLCAATTVLPGEDRAALHARVTAWTRDLDPQSDLESYFVADAVAASWKLDRGRRVEAVALRQHVAAAATHFDAAKVHRRDLDGALLEREPLEALRSLGQGAAGCRWLVERWRHLGDALRRRGAWDDAGCHDFLALLGHEPSVEGLDHPETRRALAAALALRHPTRPTPELLVAALGRILRLHLPAPLSFEAIDGKIAELRRARRPEGREALRAAAEALRAAWPEAAASRRNLEAWVAQQLARWEARLAEEIPREAAARAAAVAEAAVDLGAAGQARLRYELAHRKAFYDALKGLRDEQARRRQAADEDVRGAFEGEVDGAPGDLDEDAVCGVEVGGVDPAEMSGGPDPGVAVGAGFRGEWEESFVGAGELPPAVTAGEGAAGGDRTRELVVGGGRAAPVAERTRDLPVAPAAERTRDRGRGAAGPSLSKTLDESLRPRNRKERKRLAAMRRDIERQHRREQARPGRGAASHAPPLGGAPAKPDLT